MIQKESVLQIGDNCGARYAKCISILGGSRIGKVSTVLKIVLRRFFNINKKVKKKLIYLGLIIGIKRWVERSTGFFVKHFENRVIVCSPILKFLGSRIYGPVSLEFKVTIYKYKAYRFYYSAICCSLSKCALYIYIQKI
jgi:large subunit ribosomal protein L14